MEDDPGRQTIGSFNPLTDDDWTEMAYVGNTQQLCQKICDGDVEFVDNWCDINPDAVDRRDHTGRTPLHLAAECSTVEVLKCLVDHGARIVARLVDGMTALHIATSRGNVEMVKVLLEKSEANEAEEADKEDRKKAEKSRSQSAEKQSSKEDAEEDEDEDDSGEEMEDASSEDDTAMTQGSFVKVGDKQSDKNALDGNDDAEPDVYDVNVLTWDTPVSPLHLAILGGHSEVITTLIGTFGADALLPIKIVNEFNRTPEHAIMTLVLAARLPGQDGFQVAHDLLNHGASSAQADLQTTSALHYLVAKKRTDMLKACFSDDKAAAKSALDHIKFGENIYHGEGAETPLTTAIKSGDAGLVECLLNVGAKPIIELGDYANAYEASKTRSNGYFVRDESVTQFWKEKVVQPVMLAVENDMPEMVLQLVDKGADINTLDKYAQERLTFDYHRSSPKCGMSLFEAVVWKIKTLEKAISKKLELPEPIQLKSDEYYLKGLQGPYARWYISKEIESAKAVLQDWERSRSKQLQEESDRPGQEQRLAALKALQMRYFDLQDELRKRKAKTLAQLHPEISRRKHQYHHDTFDETMARDKTLFDPRITFRVSVSEEVADGYLDL